MALSVAKRFRDFQVTGPWPGWFGQSANGMLQFWQIETAAYNQTREGSV